MAEHKTQHTPLEWSQVYFPLLKERHIRYYGDGTAETLAIMNSGDSDTDKANAKYIVNCVNSHDKLVEALKEIAETNGKDEQDVFDEWTEAEAFHKVRKLAQDVLKQVEED